MEDTSKASLPFHGGFDPSQEFGHLGVDSWLLPTLQAPAHDPIDVVGTILLTGQRASRVTLGEKDAGVSLVNRNAFRDSPTLREGVPGGRGETAGGSWGK